MNKKFLALCIATFLISGCNDGSQQSSIIPPTDVIPPTDIIPPATYIARLVSSDKVVKGEVECNSAQVAADGSFQVMQGQSFHCQVGILELGQFTAPFPAHSSSYSHFAHDNLFETSFDLVTLYGDNVTKVLQSIDSVPNDDAITLTKLNAFDVTSVFDQGLSDEAVNEYFAKVEEEATDVIDKAPSSHLDSSIVPAVDADASSNLNDQFVSANAESAYAYKPSSEAKVLTRSQLTDHHGTPLVGVNFYSASAIGVTDDSGEFEYLWGETLTFGVDTFEFGSVVGNKVNYKLTDVTDNAVTQDNIQSLIERYAVSTNGSLKIPQIMQDTFATYPNVINELINLTLPNGGQLEGSQFALPNEFENQFNHGLAATIDQALRQPATFSVLSKQPHSIALNSGTYVTDSLKAIFHNVEAFHVFNDTGSFYGATGYTRGMRALNLSNRAFPVVMPRTDLNRELDFGSQQAWTREGRPYIAQWPDINMPEIPLVNKDNATFGFPFVSAGEIGQGKIVVMGNGLYPSILSCPNNYWNNRSVQIDSVKQTCISTKIENVHHDDKGSMKQFFANLFRWFNAGESIQGTNVATNINTAYFSHANSKLGLAYDFFVNPDFGFGEVARLGKGHFGNLSPEQTPILILQAYPPKLIEDGMTNQFVADLDNPNLTQDDITNLINYVNAGGNILFMDALQSANPEPIGRLADAAGMSVGGQNVTPTNQAFCDSSYYCQTMRPNLHVKGGSEMVVLERFQDHNGQPPFTVNQDGSVEWLKDDSKIKFEIPTYEMPKLNAEGKPELDSQGRPIMLTKYARIFVNTPEERQAAILELQEAFEGTPICTHEYEYEFNCIETRSGHGYSVRGNYHRPDFDRYEISGDVIESMVKAANLGSSLTSLYNHEIYYRTKGQKGIRLSSAELNQAYDNLSVWMWNANPYRYETNIQDELGFKETVQFLNCYTNDQHQTDTVAARCPADLKASLVEHEMIYGHGELTGQMNPSYPLNYAEKPLTRIMLGRSYWDHNIAVDTTQYPGRTNGVTTTGIAWIETNGSAVTYSAGNNQSTGFWAPQLQQVTVTGGVEAVITVMMADDLTGRPLHEARLKRPPRMQTSYQYNGVHHSFTAPYGGLIYIQPKEHNLGPVAFNLEGVETAAWWKEGAWIHSPESATAPIAEIDTGSFIYTTAINNVTSTDLKQFAADMNRFAEAASDFYGRDETVTEGAHRRFTYEELNAFRHRFVNDIQISIGSAHSGYPVMNSGFKANSTSIPTNAVNDWLLWHEIGHNLASAPFTVPGSTEVTNNLLALYMQELEGRNENPRMDRLIFDIQKAPMWLEQNNGHAWAHGDAGLRLVMFGQLKLWANSIFKVDNWYPNSTAKPTIYGDDEGWNMFKLMHRKARGDAQGDNGGTNYCSASETGLSQSDLLLVCSSYVSGFDLRDFFTTWNVGETSVTTPDGTKVYNGGISRNALNTLDQLRLPKPANDPLAVDSLNYNATQH